MPDAAKIIKDWCASCGMPEPSDGECHALAVAISAAAPVVLPEPDAWREGAKFALEAVSKVDSICWLTDSMKEVCIKQAAEAVIAERDRLRALLATGGQAQAVPKLDDAWKVRMLDGQPLVRDKGYRGWNNDCTQQHLSDLLRQCVDKGDPVDVANFCAFLLARGETIAQLAAPVAAGKREAFEAWARSYGSWEVKRDDDQALGTTGYTDLTLTVAWHAIQGRAALAATPAAALVDKSTELQGSMVDKNMNLQGLEAAPVVLPEPFALYDGEKWYANEEAAICSCANMQKLQKVYTEQQVRALLATGGQAQAVEKSATHGMNLGQRILHVGGRENAQTYIEFGGVAAVRALVDQVLRDLPDGAPGFVLPAPQAQADARDAATFEQRMSDWQHGDALDAERYRWLRSRDLETISQGGVFAGMTPQNVILNEEDLDQAVDAAIAAAKGE